MFEKIFLFENKKKIWQIGLLILQVKNYFRRNVNLIIFAFSSK